MCLKPGLHIVVTIAEYASDDAPIYAKRILTLSTHRLQIFLEKNEYLRSLQLCEDQVPREKPKKRVCNHVLAILTTFMETRQQTSDNLIVKDYCFIIEIFEKFSFSGILRGYLSHLNEA